MNFTDRISVRLDEDTRRRLTAKAEGSGKNESELVREALAAYLRRPKSETCLDLARRHRLIGCAKHLPPDLSANRQYLKSFGR